MDSHLFQIGAFTPKNERINFYSLISNLYPLKVLQNHKGSNEGINLVPSTSDEPFTSRIFKTIWELKKKGRAEATLRGISRKLKQLSRETNLDDPEAAKNYSKHLSI